MSGTGMLNAMVRGVKYSQNVHRRNSFCALFCLAFIGWGFCFDFNLKVETASCIKDYFAKSETVKPSNVSNSSGICKYINSLFSRGKMVCFRWNLDVNSKQVDRAAGGWYQASCRGPTPHSWRKWTRGIGGKGNQICQVEYWNMKGVWLLSKL